MSFSMQGSSEIQECGVHRGEPRSDLLMPGSLMCPPFLQVMCSSLQGCGLLFTLLLAVAWNSGMQTLPQPWRCPRTKGRGRDVGVQGRSLSPVAAPPFKVTLKRKNQGNCSALREISKPSPNYCFLYIQENSAQEVQWVCPSYYQSK